MPTGQYDGTDVGAHGICGVILKKLRVASTDAGIQHLAPSHLKSTSAFAKPGFSKGVFPIFADIASKQTQQGHVVPSSPLLCR